MYSWCIQYTPLAGLKELLLDLLDELSLNNRDKKQWFKVLVKVPLRVCGIEIWSHVSRHYFV